jgi:plastocyanin
MRFSSFIVASVAATAVSAKEIWVQVRNNQSATNGTAVFEPRHIVAKLNDTVFFNFTGVGNHTATQSTFDRPCVPAHESNITINGFNSDWRNGTTPTILSVPILPDNVNKTMWFYDLATCGIGGVGVINANDSSYETLDGFTRNAIRLNGTGSSSSSSSRSSSHSATGTGASASETPASGSGNGAETTALRAGMAVVPLVLAALVL